MVQIGSTDLPIIIIPRINGKEVTQTEIKTVYSNAYVDDTNTPLSFVLEIRKVGGEVIKIDWTELKSTETKIYFEIPNNVWSIVEEYTVVIYWVISGERNSVIAPFHLSVEDLHKK